MHVPFMLSLVSECLSLENTLLYVLLKSQSKFQYLNVKNNHKVSSFDADCPDPIPTGINVIQPNLTVRAVGTVLTYECVDNFLFSNAQVRLNPLPPK